MHTVGQILRETREDKLYTIEDVEKAIKIRKELLVALESDDYSKLPPSTFVQGFIKNYSKFLDLDSEKLLAIFRRGFEDKKHKPYVMDAFANPVEEKKIQITPTRVLSVVVVLIILSFFGYLWSQYRDFVGAPKLEITSPQDQQTLTSDLVVVEGKTDPEVKVLVNNQEIPVSEQGTFKKEIMVSSEMNKISIVAASKFGQQTEIQRTVYVKKE